MKRVTGIGGVFFKSKDSAKSKAWYNKHLGIESGEHGGGFNWRSEDDPDEIGFTAWSIFEDKTKYFDPATKPFMINYRVENLEELIKTLASEGVEIVGDMEVYSYGKFGWIMDPDGNKIELWEPLGEGL